MAKYIFVTGGVVSSLGKGIAAASIGCLLESRGLSVTLQKFDPYLNVDPGTMSPFQHGEVFVTDDGAETDLDLGHYERFTHAPLTQANNLTSGRIYEQIISRERRGDYLGKTVQVIPHVTNEIKAGIQKGPLVANMILYEDLEYYRDGVYRHVDGIKLGNHAIVLVGWDNSDDSWIAMNSWGPECGQKGFFKVAWDDVTLPGRYTWAIDVERPLKSGICNYPR